MVGWQGLFVGADGGGAGAVTRSIFIRIFWWRAGESASRPQPGLASSRRRRRRRCFFQPTTPLHTTRSSTTLPLSSPSFPLPSSSSSTADGSGLSSGFSCQQQSCQGSSPLFFPHTLTVDMARLVAVCRDGEEEFPFEKRQIPLYIDDTLTVSRGVEERRCRWKERGGGKERKGGRRKKPQGLGLSL